MSNDDHSNGDCGKCKALEEQLFRLTMERQLLVEQLAEERERANALFVSYPPQERLEAAAQLQLPVEAEIKPLRYQVVDQLNYAVSHLPGYELARRFARVLTTS
jgi:hypothetical protein